MQIAKHFLMAIVDLSYSNIVKSSSRLLNCIIVGEPLGERERE